MGRNIFLLFTSIFVLLIFSNCSHWAYQLQDADPVEIANSGFDIIVMDYSRDGTEETEYSAEEIQLIKNARKKPIAYISIGEAEDYRFYWQNQWEWNPPEWLGNENPEWEGNYAVKYWNDGWKDIVFYYLNRIINQGFEGVYLDKVDEFEYWSDPDNGEGFYLPEEEAASRMIDFVIEIANYCRSQAGNSFWIVPQNGERILIYDNGELLQVISGWAVEDLFYDGTTPVPQSEIDERTYYLDMVRSLRKPVFSVDYVDDGSGYSGENKTRIDDYILKALNKTYLPYAARSDRELDELNVIDDIQP